MKTIKINRDENPRLFHFLFEIYLKIYHRKWNHSEHYKHNVYDHLGIIDTLGSHGDNGKYTFYHSEELGMYFGFNLPFIKIMCID